MSFSKGAEIQKLTEGDNTIQSGAVSASGTYTAVYHVSLLKAKTDGITGGTDRPAAAGEEDSSGTN